MAKIKLTLPIVSSGGGGSGATNLSYTASPTNGIVTSDTGNDATIPLADNTNAGLLSPEDKIKLDNTNGDQDLQSVLDISGEVSSDESAITFKAELDDYEESFTEIDRYGVDIQELQDSGIREGINISGNQIHFKKSESAVDGGAILSSLHLIQNESSTGADAIIKLPITEGAETYTLATLDDIPAPVDISGKVPYTGATTNVDLGEFQVKAGQVELDQTPTGTFGVAKIRWNDFDGTAEIGLKGGNVTLQIGQELVKRVVNKTVTNITLQEANYQVVKITGATGQRLSVDLAQANNEINSIATLGVVTENILNNQEGFITYSGEVNSINTTGSLQGETWIDGDVLYLSATTPGKMTNIKPVAPNHTIVVGYVEYAHAINGKIFVKVDNGYGLEELHDVLLTAVANNDGMFYESATGLWKNKPAVMLEDLALKLDAQFAIDINRQGIVTRTETTISFDGTNTFTITPTATTWSYYRLGIKYTISGAKTVIIPGTPIASGTWFIYIDSMDGSLTASQTVWSLTDGKVPVASINFNNALTPKYWLADERHTAVIDNYMQYYLHNVDGARSLNTPTLAGYTINTDTNVAKTFSITAGTLIDQDYIHSLDSLPDPNGTATDYIVWYRTALGVWTWKQSNMPFTYNSGTDWIQWDNSGTMTDATGGAGGLTRWVNSYLLLTNKEGAARFSIVAGRGIFTTLAAAEAESIGTFDWSGFPIAESVIAYQLTWSTVTSTSQGKCRLAATPKLVNISTVTNNSSGAGTDHNTLSNLQGGTIGEYYHVTVAEKNAILNETLGFACSDETSAITTGLKVTFRMPYAMTLSSIRISLTEAATIGNFIVDVKQNGTSVFSTLVSIDSTELTSTTAATPPVLSTTALTDDSLMTIHVTQIGSGDAGKGLKLLLIGNKS